MSTILFSHKAVNPRIKDRLFLKAFLRNIFLKEEIEFKTVHYIFCNDEFLLSLNKFYLNHSALTDILTFVLSDINKPVESEIYISVARVMENAFLFEVDYIIELRRVMIHGILHLCGYDDHSKQQKIEMRKKEDYYLHLFHVKRST